MFYFYFGLICGLPVGFIASIAFPGVVARLRADYFAKVNAAARIYGLK